MCGSVAYVLTWVPTTASGLLQFVVDGGSTLAASVPSWSDVNFVEVGACYGVRATLSSFFRTTFAQASRRTGFDTSGGERTSGLKTERKRR